MVLIVSLALFFVTVIWLRVAPVDVEKWHVDPQVVEKSSRPNQYLMRDGQDVDSMILDLALTDLAEKIEKLTLLQPSVTVLAGSAVIGHVTYEQRSKFMAFPDYITVKIVSEDDGKSRLIIYSRSRFGYFDLGVNRTRIKAWTAALQSPIAR